MLYAQIQFSDELMVEVLILNLGLLGLHLFLSGLCFLGAVCLAKQIRAGIWRRIEHSVYSDPDAFAGRGGHGVLKYLTPMTLFDPKAIAAGNGELWMTAVLYLGGVLLYGLGITIFSKKDLSL